MHVLVTGGCGFIGSTLVPALLRAGHAVTVLDDASTGDPRRLPADARLVRGDVRDRAALVRATAGADAVVHLAARCSVPGSVADPLGDFDVNAAGTLATLRAAVAAGAGRFVFASAGGALLGDAPLPADERNVPRPISPYGASKLSGEAYCSAFLGSYGLSTIALRFANVYGPGSDRKPGVVPAFIRAALAGEPLLVYGDGSATRDHVHVDDLCDGILRALGAVHTGPFHLCSERETSVLELAGAVLAATDADGRIEHRPARVGEVDREVGRATRAALAFGFRAETALEAGLAETAAWFRAHEPAGLARAA